MSFSKDLQKFAKKAIENQVKIKRLSSFELFSLVVIGTPVDKGVLRNNWFASVNSGSTKKTDSSDTTGQGTINGIENDLRGITATNDVYLTNNLPYGPRIEFDGHSGKAPEGMVRINVKKWGSIVERNAKKVENAN